MIIFAICIVGLMFTIVKIIGQNWKSSLSDNVSKKMVDRRENFIYNASATTYEIDSIKANTNYSDVVMDFSMIMGHTISSIDIANHIKYQHKFATNNQALTWESAVIMLRLSKQGKIHPGVIETHGLYVIEESSFYQQPIKFYNLLSSNINKMGIKTEAVICGNDAIKTINFIQFTTVGIR